LNIENQLLKPFIPCYIFQSNCVRKKDSLPKSHSKPSLSIRDQLFKYGGDFKSQVDDKKGLNLQGIMRRPGGE